LTSRKVTGLVDRSGDQREQETAVDCEMGEKKKLAVDRGVGGRRTEESGAPKVHRSATVASTIII
jgi:hypothetical protein